MRIVPRFRWTVSSLLLILIYAGFALAAEWTTPEQDLAHKIAAVTGPGAVALNVTNHSSLAQSEVADIERGLRGMLSDLGLALVASDQAAATVQVWLSEDLQNFVWIAQIHQGTNEPSLVMVSAAQNDGAVSQQHAPSLAIRKTLLWQQPQRILDAAVLDESPAHLLLLDENGVTIFRSQNSQWKAEQVLVISHDKPWPRDLRGRIIPRKDHPFDAYLPGMFCRSSATAVLAMNCRQSDDPWPLVEGQPVNAFFSPTRNFFTGVLSPGIGKQTTAAAFYSAAALPRPNYTLWLLAGVDGRIHLLDGMNDQIAATTNWGSDIAAIRSNCGSGLQVLASGSAAGHETLQAFAVTDREVVAVTGPSDFNGEITALWADAGGTSAVAVSRNLQTGAYEAYRLSIACGQ